MAVADRSTSTIRPGSWPRISATMTHREQDAADAISAWGALTWVPAGVEGMRPLRKRSRDMVGGIRVDGWVGATRARRAELRVDVERRRPVGAPRLHAHRGVHGTGRRSVIEEAEKVLGVLAGVRRQAAGRGGDRDIGVGRAPAGRRLRPHARKRCRSTTAPATAAGVTNCGWTGCFHETYTGAYGPAFQGQIRLF